MTNSISYLLWISILIPNYKSHNIIMSARAYFMKRVKDCKDVYCVYNVSSRYEQWRRQGHSVCILQFSCFSTTVCSQNINKQNVNIADETLTDYCSSFLSIGIDHYTKSKNYLKRRSRIRHWIPMFFGTPSWKIIFSFHRFLILWSELFFSSANVFLWSSGIGWLKAVFI